MMNKAKYITVLDFEIGRVFQYKLEVLDNVDDNTYERFLSGKGHNLSNCEWMVHEIAELVSWVDKLQTKYDR